MSALLAKLLSHSPTMPCQRPYSLPKTTKQAYSVASAQVLSWSALVEDLLFGATNLRRKCKYRGQELIFHMLTIISIYQEYLAKTLTEKYNTLNVHLDKVVNNATSEMNILNQQLSSKKVFHSQEIAVDCCSGMQIDQDRLKAENSSLVTAFREKHRKYQQTQELYDRLKRKEMTAATQTAAFDSVEEVLGNVSSRQGLGIPSRNVQYPAGPAMSAQRGPQPAHYDYTGGEHLATHQRTNSNHSQGSGGMPPPPLRRPGGLNKPLGYCKSRQSIFYQGY